MIEEISHDGVKLALLLKARYTPTSTEFLTNENDYHQIGLIVYPEGGEIMPHVHNETKREIWGTTETIIVKSGNCILDIYTSKKEHVASRKLEEGDLAVLYHTSGHGFRMLEDTVLLEVKQGPYAGEADKVRFKRSV